MNTLQKSLVSSVAIVAFSAYAYFLRGQDQAIIATAEVGNAAQQNVVDTAPPATSFTVPPPQPSAPIVQNVGEDGQEVTYSREREGGEDGSEDGGRVRPPVTAPAQPKPVTKPVVTKSEPAPAPAPAPIPVPPPVAQPSGRYKNGTYTGSSVDVFYGFVQVQVTIAGGKLADVSFLSYPNDRSTSRRISSEAMPMLIQEALQAQSAQVDGVSGASETSRGFIESLSSALSQA